VRKSARFGVDRPGAGQPGQVRVTDPLPGGADPLLRLWWPPGLGEAGQRRVQFGVAGGPAVQHDDPAVGDVHPPARSQPDQLRAHEPEAELGGVAEPPRAGVDGQQHQVLTEGLHPPTVTPGSQPANSRPVAVIIEVGDD
jgi:hypothetical protein